MNNITYGEKLALVILISNDLGGNFGYIDQCKALINKKVISPVYIGALEKEYLKANAWIIKNNLMGAANLQTKKYI